MSKELKSNPTEEVTDLIDAQQPVRDDAQERAGKCTQEISRVLAEHNCRIMPHIDPNSIEPVGLSGNKIQIEATFWIAPLAAGEPR
tara:strand:- start:603 stop:860 length:258 start_codon:yes stop_codon:yes gene_type:complete